MARAVRDRLPDVYWSVSVTTRPPRPGEAEGEDYHFVSPEDFNELMLEDQFLEWAEVYGNRYGTLAHPVEEARQAGRTALLELDVQGALEAKARIPDAARGGDVEPLHDLAGPDLPDAGQRLQDGGDLHLPDHLVALLAEDVA